MDFRGYVVVLDVDLVAWIWCRFVVLGFAFVHMGLVGLAWFAGLLRWLVVFWVWLVVCFVVFSGSMLLLIC